MMETMDYKEKEKEKRREEKPKPRPKQKTTHNKIFILFIIGVLVLPMFFFMTRNQPEEQPVQQPVEQPTQQPTDTQIPYIQNIVLLVKYNHTLCPDLQVEHSSSANPDKVEVLDIKQVKDIDVEVNYAELGEYDTNNQDIVPLLNWVNVGECTPDALIISNTEFLKLLMDLGVPVEDSTG